MRGFGFISDCHGDAYVSVMTVRGEGLRAAEDPMVSVACGDSTCTTGVGAGSRFGEGPRANFLSLREWSEIFLLLCFGAELENVVRTK